MTEHNAIEVLSNFDMQVSAKADGAYQSTIGEMACKVAIAALEKRIKKEPVDYCMFFECPSCGNVEILHCNYCPDCGQALDWSDKD